MKEFTRTQRINNECTHREYFGQFVNNEMKHIVKIQIGVERLLASTDIHLNDIPLKEWDRLSSYMKSCLNTELWKRTAHSTYKDPPTNVIIWSLSDGVCIAKEAAQQIIDEVKNASKP